MAILCSMANSHKPVMACLPLPGAIQVVVQHNHVTLLFFFCCFISISFRKCVLVVMAILSVVECSCLKITMIKTQDVHVVAACTCTCTSLSSTAISTVTTNAPPSIFDSPPPPPLSAATARCSSQLPPHNTGTSPPPHPPPPHYA